MQGTVACVIIFALALGAGLAAQANRRILIVADDLTLQFC
jgi:hypothetical protein